MPLRFDKGSLRSPEVLTSGWLRVDAYLTRTGIFTYLNPDGTLRRELRLPEEVFSPATLDSFAMVPVTNDHPPGLLDADNTRQFQVGQLSENIKRDGDFVASRLLVTDAAAIADIRAGKVELSCGYDCELEMTPGKTDAGEYDAIQRNIRGNHVAIVDKGRAGPAAKIKMDRFDAYMVGVEGFKILPKRTDMEKVEVTIAGKKYMVSAELAAELEASIAEEGAETPAEEGAEPKDGKAPAIPPAPKGEPPMPKGDKALLLRLATDNARLTAERDAARSTHTKEAQKKADANLRAELTGQIKNRMTLEATAARVLGKKFKADGQTDRAIREAMITHFDPSAKLDGKPDAYVDARFDLALESEGEDALAGVRETAEGRDDSDDEPDAPAVDIDKIRRDAATKLLARGRAKLTIGTTK